MPVSSCRAFADFLANYYYDDQDGSSPLFKKSIIPEKTHLQTNFVINSDSHSIVGALAFYLNVIATLAATPVLYYDGELNTHYSDLVKNLSVMGIIKKLEESGIDVRGIVQERLASSTDGGGGGLFELLAMLDKQLAPTGFTTLELLQIADDCGLSLEDILAIYAYLTSSENNDAAASRAMTQKQPLVGTPDHYLLFMENWLKENNVNNREKIEK